jgi:hypothetical protein
MPVQVFLSAVSDQFRQYRDLLRHDLTRHNVEVKIQEDFKGYGGVTLKKLDTYVRSCDAVVHLVGDMVGSIAKEQSSKFVLAEYDHICEKVPRLQTALDSTESLTPNGKHGSQYTTRSF